MSSLEKSGNTSDEEEAAADGERHGSASLGELRRAGCRSRDERDRRRVRRRQRAVVNAGVTSRSSSDLAGVGYCGAGSLRDGGGGGGRSRGGAR